MKEKSIGLKIIYAAFIIIICSSWILWFFLEKYTDTTNYENRQMAEQPRLTLDTYRQFSMKFNSYFNDNIPFRNSLVTLNNAIDYFVFKRSSDSRVAIGSDNWLFYCSVADGDPIACYKGENLLSEDELSDIAANCINQRDYLDSLGKEFVIFIAPNKERMYSEHMPGRFGEPAENYMALQIVTYLREHTDIRIVYPYDELMSTKASIEEIIYYKTDTHWNSIGAYVGSRALLHELGVEMPALDSGEITIENRGSKSGDLAGFIGLAKSLEFADSEYSIEGYDKHGYNNLNGDQNGVALRSAENADKRRLYVFRDSFASAMIPYLGSQFNESCFRHYSSYSYDDFISYDPDIFVYETVERYVGRLATFAVKAE